MRMFVVSSPFMMHVAQCIIKKSKNMNNILYSWYVPNNKKHIQSYEIQKNEDYWKKIIHSDKGDLFIGPGVDVYEGMIVGLNSRGEDLAINVCKEKHLTNTRASGSDDALRLVPPIQMSLEKAIEFIQDDELVEVTPKSIRLRKKILDNKERERATRNANK